MTSIKFLLRPSKRAGLHSGSLCVRIIHCRKVKQLTLPVRLYPDEWDDNRQCIIPCHEDNPRYNYLCHATETFREYKEQFDETIIKLEKSGRYRLSDIALGCHNHRSHRSLSGYVQHLSRQLERSGQERTAKAYLTACRSLIAFNKGKDIPLRHINACLMKEYETYLKDCGKAMNTISYYMRMLRAIYHRAVKDRLIDSRRENPFENVFTGNAKTQKRALSVEELQTLNKLEFADMLNQFKKDGKNGKQESKREQKHNTPANDYLYTCWRYFFFCFFARGMSFVDLAYLRKENIRQGVISYYRKKTGQKIEITLTPVLQRIIDSFSDDTGNSPFLFPIIRQGKPHRRQYENGLRLQNRRLKKLAACAGLELRWGLTTHVTRHSWATTGKMQHLPLSVISEGLGHSSEKMTYTYLASFDTSTLDKANECIAQAIVTGNNTGRQNRVHRYNYIDFLR